MKGGGGHGISSPAARRRPRPWAPGWPLLLTPGAVVAYRGGLGMGKTAFTRGLARGLGYKGRVTSPTFTIVNEYEGGRLPLFHFDMYRLEGADALFDIGWEDYLDRGGVCAVEWSELAEEALPPETIFVTIAREPGGGELRGSSL